MNETWNRILALLVAFIVGLFGVFGLTGCASLQPAAFPKEMTAALEGAVQQVADQGVLDEFITNMRGHVLEPGIESYTQIRIAAGVKIVGVDGDMVFETSGTGTQLPAEYRQTLLDMLDNPDLTPEQREGIFTILGWNRVSSDHNPPPTN